MAYSVVLRESSSGFKSILGRPIPHDSNQTHQKKLCSQPADTSGAVLWQNKGMHMLVGSLKEADKSENRVAMTPDSAIQIQKLGHECLIQSGAGLSAGFTDQAYEEAGVTVVKTKDALMKQADIIVKVRCSPSDAEAKKLRADQTLISFFYPAQNDELLDTCVKTQASVIAMDMVPRISRAQKMDALSSMANIAGYRAVIEAGNQFGRFFTGQVTAAGKVPPAKVLVIGAGVAGLAAIGTATSLGGYRPRL